MPRVQLDRIPKKGPGSQPFTYRSKYRLSDIRNALRKSLGVIADAARALEISNNAVHAWLVRHPELREFVARVRQEHAEQIALVSFSCTSRALQGAHRKLDPREYKPEDVTPVERDAIKQGLRTKLGREIFPAREVVFAPSINSGPTMNVVLTPEVVRQLPRDVRARLLQGDPIEVDRIAEAAQGPVR